MERTQKRVVITGVGPVTPIGSGKEAYWDALMMGKSGAEAINFEDYDMEQYYTKIACPIQEFALENFMGKARDLKYLGRTSQLALAGTKLALEDAGLELGFVEKGRNQGDYFIRGKGHKTHV